MTDPRKLEADETDDFELVSQDPAAWYETPQAVLDDQHLAVAEKARLLEEWARDLADRSGAADEGMVPAADGGSDRDVRMLDRVSKARAILGATADNDAALSPSQRLWRRIAGAFQGGDAKKLTL